MAARESCTDNGWMASSAFCRRSLSFSTPHWGPARTASGVLGSHSKRVEARAPHDRNDGVVRLTDVPLEAGGRAYLVERGLEEEGSNANAALHALIADYLRQASVLDAVPMAEGHGRR